LKLRCAPALVSALLLAGCNATGRTFDYGAYMARAPRSILLLPPLDETPSTEACYGWLATASHALAERGYYVFPVAVVDRMLRENGLPTAGEMHAAPLDKLREVFGADAVLYVTVTEWGTSYEVLDSVTRVGAKARLVDTESGAELWHGEALVAQGAGGGGNGLAGMLASAIVNQIASKAHDRSPEVARATNRQLFEHARTGLLLGPYHPDQAADTASKREAMAKDAARPAPATRE
jgi:hypothetical protein